MIIEDIVFSMGQAAGAAGLTALINARLYPVGKETEPTKPCVIFTKGDQHPVEGYYSDTGWFYTEVSFEVLASTARGAALVAEQVRAVYTRYHGTVGTAKVDDVTTIGQGAAYYDEELGCFCEELEFKFFHTE